MSKKLFPVNLKDETKELITDLSEMGLDKAIETVSIESKWLQDLPIVKWLFIANDAKTSLQTVFFVKKYASFIGQVKDIAEPNELVNELLEDEKEVDQLIDHSMLYLDRYHTELKAKLLGELFIQTFKFKKFSVSEYNDLMFGIGEIHPYQGMGLLKRFYEYHQETQNIESPEQFRDVNTRGSAIPFYSIANTGLLHLPNGGSRMDDLGGAMLNELGVRFYENVITKIA
ncbi:hypothetical protein [Vibrio coralliilyticus]|uniref:hypothetical protein n=1 Tax=Vibrio coralliilyticus TaxID=190893 RepID=UPI0002F53C32|nr:hypothetical protein [Vibrio coralliilyticus]